MLHAQQRAEDVGVEGGRIRLGGLLRHGTGLAFGTRVVDRHVQAAETLDGPIDQAADIVLVTHVGSPELGLGAGRSEFIGQLLAFLIASAGDDDPRAFPGKCLCRGTPDTCQSTSNQNDGTGHERSPFERCEDEQIRRPS